MHEEVKQRSLFLARPSLKDEPLNVVVEAGKAGAGRVVARPDEGPLPDEVGRPRLDNLDRGVRRRVDSRLARPLHKESDPVVGNALPPEKG